ncbi:MAG TPA: glycosyl hydrolase [Bryobacteraceae bacterium]|nr:glycosyl hydrolase [Bryobacteraceae bacterium]
MTTFQVVLVFFSTALWVSGSSLPVPASGAYLGIWADPAHGNPEAAIEVREGPAPNGINHRFALHLHYYAWKNIAAMLNNGVLQPDVALQGDISHGRVPVISWVCDGSVPNSDHVIASGDANEDAIITATARALAQYPGPVLLRWFWEFNVLGNNQSCRGDTGGTPTQQVYADFIGAWRRIRQLFQTAGASNVVFLWNPGHYTADANADDPHGFYPGNDYVDWIGLDTYQDSTSATFATNIEPFYSDFSQAQYAGKPLMVGENGSQNWSEHSQEFQAAYLQGLLSDLQENRFPQLKAYCYFDSAGQHGSWILDDNNGQGNGGLAAFASMAASAVFSPPAITLVANAEGEKPVIAPNTWVEIKGLNLAGTTRIWQTSDFTNSQMPIQLDKVSATLNGKSAYVYYISPTQVNILTPPDAISGQVQVQVTNNSAVSTSYIAQAQALSPSFFVFNGGPYVAATHANGTLLGPASLYPGSSTPAKPGETIVIYANGFGATSTPVVSGSPMQSGTLSQLPDIKIAGISSEVQFAGLNITPGEFQFNIVVPPNTPDGDQTIVATYRGVTTPSGTLLTVQR